MAINVKDKLVTVESLGIAYSTEQGARQEADQALSTRIDNIVAPEGDPSLTEVSDARVSGQTTYNTLKARLDADKASIGTEMDEIKADLDIVNDLVDYSPIITVSGSTPGTWKNGLKTLDGQALEANVKYMMTIELGAAQASKGYLYLLNSDDTTYSTKDLGAGQTSYSFEITSTTARTIKAIVGFSASGVGVTFQFYKKNRTTRLDTIESSLSSTQSKVVSILTQNHNISATSTDGIYVTRYSGQEGNTASDDASCATGYVEVLPKTVVKISGVYLSGNRTVATYDRDKHYIECLTSESLSTTSLVVETGSNVRYIRATGRTGVTPTFEYLSVTSDQEVTEYNAVNGYRALYAESAKTPVVSIIDDDTWETQYVADLKSLCDTLGIKITFACLTSRFDVDANLASTLLGYEREGHAIITHGYTQGTFYDLSTRDMALAEADLVHGIQDLHAKGFSDYKAMWATPFGRYDDDLKKLAIKWGFESLVRYDYQEKVENPYEGNPKQRYQIYRYALVDGNGTITTNTAKNLIDKAVACNGWFLFGVHSASQYCRSEEFRTAMTEIITYARNSGCEIRTATEELRRRMPIYRNYEKY